MNRFLIRTWKFAIHTHGVEFAHRDESVADEMCHPHFTVTQKAHDFADDEGQRYRDVDHVGRELLTSHSVMTLIGFRDRCLSYVTQSTLQ